MYEGRIVYPIRKWHFEEKESMDGNWTIFPRVGLRSPNLTNTTVSLQENFEIDLEDTNWILTSSFIIFTMQTGKNRSFLCILFSLIYTASDLTLDYNKNENLRPKMCHTHKLFRFKFSHNAFYIFAFFFYTFFIE